MASALFLAMAMRKSFRMRWTLATRLTLVRIALAPLMVAGFYAPFAWGHELAAVVFAVASLTDWLDGWLARARNEITPFGRFLDPVADKLIVAAALVALVDRGWASPIAAMIIIAREIAISALREWLAERNATLAVSALGKLKTVAQMVAITLLLWHEPLFGWPTAFVGAWLLWLAAALTLLSGGFYLRSAWQELQRAH